MRVLVCDDHRLLVDCLSAVFTAKGHEVEHASSPADAAAFLTGSPVDVCVLDLGFPEMEGAEAVAHVRKAHPAVPIVIFTGTSDPEVLQQARDHGADGYVSKDDSVTRLVGVVEQVFRPGPAPAWAPARADRPEASPHFLTPRERQTLEGLVQGYNTTELARWMGVRQSTVSTHVQTVLTKLGVHSRLEAVARAVSERIVVHQG